MNEQSDKSLLELLEECQKALESEKRYHATLDNMMEGFQMIDRNWRYIYVNDTVVRQSKYTREELIGFTMMEKYPGIEQTEMFKRLEHCMYNGVSEKFENEFLYPDNSKGWFELSIQPIREGLFILSMEITKRKRAEYELQKLNEDLENLVNIRTAQLENKNKDILASINYAKNIQNAFLSDKSGLFKILPDVFVINKPKDIVSGDFIWFKEKDGEVLLAVVDCTGHGVPGALISMIAVQKLNEVFSQGTDISEVLHSLNKKIKAALSQNENMKSARDGMDIVLCSVHIESGVLQYTGANRPLWLIPKDQHELIEIKATNKSIGGLTEDHQFFETHSLQLKKGDLIYLCSDGYADQFGGEKGKKLTTKKFKQLLLENSSKTMEEQRKQLCDFSQKWLGDTEQIDDILVVGVRL